MDTAGGVVVSRFLKERISPDPRTYIGKGAVEEVGEAAKAERVKLIVFDDELSPGQVRNLEEAWGEKVRVPRPAGPDPRRLRAARAVAGGAHPGRARAAPVPAAATGRTLRPPVGAGRRHRRPGSAGEQKLELDRRKIRDRIARLRGDLKKIEVARLVRRRGRRRYCQVAIAGYTNAGKTTLFNRLTRDAAYAADRLFATLDARAAKAISSKMGDVIFVDTVGFVRKLPTSLVASFRSTLSEIKEADLVLHVLDASSDRSDEEERVAVETFEELGVAARAHPGRLEQSRTCPGCGAGSAGSRCRP